MVEEIVRQGRTGWRGHTEVTPGVRFVTQATTPLTTGPDPGDVDGT
jgi:hypothetical protein